MGQAQWRRWSVKPKPCPIHGCLPVFSWPNENDEWWCPADDLTYFDPSKSCLVIYGASGRGRAYMVGMWNIEIEVNSRFVAHHAAIAAATKFLARRIEDGLWDVDLPCGHTMMKQHKSKPTLGSKFVVAHLAKCSLEEKRMYYEALAQRTEDKP